MLVSFTRYFLNYIFGARNRQKLVFLAVGGLVISSFALIVLQSAMGGLQESLMGRSKRVIGDSVYELHQPITAEESSEIIKKANSLGFSAFGEYELEVLLRYDTYMGGAIIHGVDPNNRPIFLKDYDLDDFLVPYGLSMNVNVVKGDKLQVISPTHTSTFMDDIPASISGVVSKLFSTNVPELDETHIWTRLSLIQNLVRQKKINTIRFYKKGSHSNFKALKDFLVNKKMGDYKTWEQINNTLVWALKLENTIMIFLFIAMTFLVSLCITSGLMIFFDKVKIDLASFWILGASNNSLNQASGLLLVFISFISSFSGLLLGVVALLLFEKFGFEILPSVFVDRKIPINITLQGILISFFVPFIISIVFSFLSLRRHKNKSDHLNQLRSVGV